MRLLMILAMVCAGTTTTTHIDPPGPADGDLIPPGLYDVQWYPEEIWERIDEFSWEITTSPDIVRQPATGVLLTRDYEYSGRHLEAFAWFSDGGSWCDDATPKVHDGYFLRWNGHRDRESYYYQDPSTAMSLVGCTAIECQVFWQHWGDDFYVQASGFIQQRPKPLGEIFAVD